MRTTDSSFVEHLHGEAGWYDLFSRGARDWLRHNDKISEAVRERLPELISSIDVLGPKPDSRVRVPVKFLEHYRFRLRDNDEVKGVGQGRGKPGDTLAREPAGEGESRGEGGNNDGSYQFVLELKIDDIVDWLWEELELPHLKRKEGCVEETSYQREGWNRRGVRSRLDRRRSMKEALKRPLPDGAKRRLANDDLRYRQLVTRKQPSTNAVVIFAMDVSSSMTTHERQLAKTFFFWVVQGLKRQYSRIEPVFLAHTVEAWEFAEQEFFQVTASGGTVASSVFNKALNVIEQRFDPYRHNIYLFYASDGANFSHDAAPAAAALDQLARLTNYMGYVETTPGPQPALNSETSKLFDNLEADAGGVGTHALYDSDSVWRAIRGFFTHASVAGHGA